MTLVPARWRKFGHGWELDVDGVSISEVQREGRKFRPIRYSGPNELPLQSTLAEAKRAVEKALKARRG